LTGSSQEVFISYSHDSEKHLQEILKLSNRLRSEGIDCVLDQYEECPPEGWPRWMDNKIREAQFVLMVCTKPYYRRVMGCETKADVGRGVKWEGSLIYNHIYQAGSQNKKFIPVLLRHKNAESIPTPLQGTTNYCVATERGYEALYCRLIGKPRVEKPPLGERRPPLHEQAIKTNFAVYLSMPIDIPLWDKARWRGTFFHTGGGLPPMLGLAFRDKASAQKIFKGWRVRYGDSDEFEELRVSIIEGDIPGEEAGYTVHIGPDPDNTIKRYKAAGLQFFNADNGILTASRINRMNPDPGSVNLERFKAAFHEHKSYHLVPALLDENNTVTEFGVGLGIHKGIIHFRHVSEILTSNDWDSVVLRTGEIKRDRAEGR
jgi:hypothetical protein